MTDETKQHRKVLDYIRTLPPDEATEALELTRALAEQRRIEATARARAELAGKPKALAAFDAMVATFERERARIEAEIKRLEARLTRFDQTVSRRRPH
jgi:hypothetical protein